jgi:hypothetical protein
MLNRTDHFAIPERKRERTGVCLKASNAEHHPIEHVSNDGRRSTEKDKI